jgi:hypothetical protein
MLREEYWKKEWIKNCHYPDSLLSEIFASKYWKSLSGYFEAFLYHKLFLSCQSKGMLKMAGNENRHRDVLKTEQNIYEKIFRTGGRTMQHIDIFPTIKNRLCYTDKRYRRSDFKIAEKETVLR